MSYMSPGSEARDESDVGEWRLESPHPRKYSRGSPDARGNEEKQTTDSGATLRH